MSTLDQVLLSARVNGDYNLVLDALPYARFLGLRAELTAEGVRVSLPFRPSLLGIPAPAALHGGTVGACLEMAALLLVVHVRGGPPIPKTVDFSVDYLRAARPETLFAQADVQRLGRRIVNVRMHAYQGQREQPVALGRGNFLVD